MTAYDVHGLRKLVTALDKNVASMKPFDEAVKYIKERYGTDAESAKAYCMYVRGLKDPSGMPAKSNPVDRRHTRFDELRGEWVEVLEEQADGEA